MNHTMLARAMVIGASLLGLACSGSQGPTGPEGPTGSNGAPGATGATGAQGNVGQPGPTGTSGPAGAPGTTGAAGSTGATGPEGPTGPAGDAGPAGPQRDAGPMGPPGVSIGDAGGVSGSVIWKDATGAVIPVVEYVFDYVGQQYLWVVDRTTGAVWRVNAATGEVGTSIPPLSGAGGQAQPFKYSSGDCTGSPYFSVSQPALFTFYGTDGNVYAPKGNVAYSNVAIHSSRPLQSPASMCGTDGAQSVILVSDCLNLGPTPPAALFVAPAHPEAVP